MDTMSFVILFLFYLYWFIQLILSQFQINGVYMPSALSTIYLMTGIICFTIGYYSIQINSCVIFNYKLNVVEKLKRSIDNLIEKKWFKILLLLTFIYVLSLDVYFFESILVGAFIRGEGEGMAQYYGPTFAKINTYYFSWYIQLLRPLFCFCLLYKKKWYLPLMAVTLFGYEILSGGRIGLIRTVMPILLILGLFKIERRYKFKLKHIVLSLFAIVAIYYGIIALTAFRLGTTEFEQIVVDGQQHSNEAIVTYFVGPAVAFDQAIHSNIIDSIGGYQLGLNVLWPLFFPVMVFLYLLGITDYINGPAGAVSDYLQWHYLTIDPVTRWNALYTWNIDFFCDAGIIGIMFYNFLFGYLLRFCFKWIYVKGTVYNLVLGSLLFVTVLQAPIKLYGLFNLLPIFVYILLFAHFRESKKLYSFKSKKNVAIE